MKIPGMLLRNRNGDAAAALLDARTDPRSDGFSSSASARHGGGNNRGSSVDGHHPSAPVLPPEETAHGDSTLAPMQPSSDSDDVSDVTDPSNLECPSANPCTVNPRPAVQKQTQQQQHLSRRCDDDLDRETCQAIDESQAAHIAHTRQQVLEEIRFRRALERASNEAVQGSVFQGAVLQSQPALVEDEADFVRMVRQSILDERNRESEAEKRYALELEFALTQSEDLVMQQQDREARCKESEEELMQGVITRSRAEEEAELRKEEDLLREAFTQSLGMKVNEGTDQEREEELLQVAVAQSLAEDAANKEKTMRYEEEQLRLALANSMGTEATVSENELVEEGIQKSLSEGKTPEDVIEEVLKLSLQEEEHIGEEEGEQLKKAMERSKLES